jgi:O-antigen/teichoic acid export membrane protein
MNTATKSLQGYLGLLSGRSAIVQRLAHGTFWVLAGTVTWRLLTAASSVLVARRLGTGPFGELSMIRSTVDLLMVFGSFQLGATAGKYVSQYRSSDPPRAGAVLLLVLIASLLTCSIVAAPCLLLSPWIAEHVMHRADLAPIMTLGVVLAFFATFAAIQEVVLSGFEAFRATACMNATRGFATIFLCVPFAALWGVKGVVVALILDAVLALSICFVILRRECTDHEVPLRIPWRGVLGEFPVLWRFALPGVLAGLVITGTMWAGRTILFRGIDGDNQLGLFSAANQWRTPILFLPSGLCRVMLPLLSKAFSAGDTAELRTAVGASLKTVCMTALPICLAAMLLADFLQGLCGVEFRQGAPVLRILMPATFLYAVDRVYERVFGGAGRRWTDLALTVGWGAIFLTGCWLAVPRFGGVGLSLALLVAYAALLIARITYVEFVLVPGSIRQDGRLLAFCAVALTVFYFAPSW